MNNLVAASRIGLGNTVGREVICTPIRQRKVGWLVAVVIWRKLLDIPYRFVRKWSCRSVRDCTDIFEWRGWNSNWVVVWKSQATNGKTWTTLTGIAICRVFATLCFDRVYYDTACSKSNTLVLKRKKRHQIPNRYTTYLVYALVAANLIKTIALAKGMTLWCLLRHQG